jgi:hypothetical protein
VKRSYPPIQNIPVRSELGKQIRRSFLMPDSHALAEIDDDGERVCWYRYVCRCGKAGAWQPSTVAARSDHAVHQTEAQR